MPWFVKIEKGVVPKAEFDQYVPAHKAYVQRLIDRGHQVLTGYWKERGGGMMVFEAASLAEAEQIVNQDPLVQNHCVAYDLHEWCIVRSHVILETDSDPCGSNAQILSGPEGSSNTRCL